MWTRRSFWVGDDILVVDLSVDERLSNLKFVESGEDYSYQPRTKLPDFSFSEVSPREGDKE